MLPLPPHEHAWFKAIRRDAYRLAGRFAVLLCAMSIIGFGLRLARPLEQAMAYAMLFIDVVSEPGTVLVATLLVCCGLCHVLRPTRWFAHLFGDEAAGAIVMAGSVILGLLIGICIAEVLYIGAGSSSVAWREFLRPVATMILGLFGLAVLVGMILMLSNLDVLIERKGTMR